MCDNFTHTECEFVGCTKVVCEEVGKRFRECKLLCVNVTKSAEVQVACMNLDALDCVEVFECGNVHLLEFMRQHLQN